MTNETKRAYEGQWRHLENLSANLKGSIHDDDQARRIGFKRGFVVGSTVATSAMPAIFSLLGQKWMEGGWYSFGFVAPVYVDDEVRENAELADGEVQLKVTTREGRLCTVGRAGLGNKVPWDSSLDGLRGADGVFKGMTIGQQIGEHVFVPDATALMLDDPKRDQNPLYGIRTMLDSARDTTPWYGESSPWGGGIVPPAWLHRLALVAILRESGGQTKLDLSGVREPLIWAEHHLALAGPLFLGKTYKIREWVADKGASGRTVFLTFEFDVTDENGREVARGRHKIKWFPA